MTDKLKNKTYLQRNINLQRFQAILENAGQSILDVGCGNGAYVLKINKELPKYKIHGLDYQWFQTWEERPEIFTIGDAKDLPYPDNSYDTITLFEVLEHLSEPEKALTEYFRVARKNIILTVPNCEYSDGMKKSLLTFYHYTDNTHVNFFTLKSVSDIITKAGFRVSKAFYINTLPLWPLLEEAFAFEGIAGRIIKKYLLMKSKRQYHITSLIVATKS